MPVKPGVEIENLAAFRRELKKLGDTGWLIKLSELNSDVAQLVVDGATTRALADGGVSAKTINVNGLRASKAAAAAQVILGGARAPFALGAEFGSNEYKQFKAWTGAGQGAGHFLYPEIRAERDRISEMYLDRMVELAAEAFPD